MPYITKWVVEISHQSCEICMKIIYDPFHRCILYIWQSCILVKSHVVQPSLNKIRLRFSAPWAYAKRSLKLCVLGQEPAELRGIFDVIILILVKISFATMLINVSWYFLQITLHSLNESQNSNNSNTVTTSKYPKVTTTQFQVGLMPSDLAWFCTFVDQCLRNFVEFKNKIKHRGTFNEMKIWRTSSP